MQIKAEKDEEERKKRKADGVDEATDAERKKRKKEEEEKDAMGVTEKEMGATLFRRLSSAPHILTHVASTHRELPKESRTPFRRSSVTDGKRRTPAAVDFRLFRLTLRFPR